MFRRVVDSDAGKVYESKRAVKKLRSTNIFIRIYIWDVCNLALTLVLLEKALLIFNKYIGIIFIYLKKSH